MPDTIQVPPRAPINKRIMIEGVQLATFDVMFFSRLSQDKRFVLQPISTQTPEAIINATWLAPSSVALPKTEMQHTRRAIRTIKGKKANIRVDNKDIHKDAAKLSNLI